MSTFLTLLALHALCLIVVLLVATYSVTLVDDPSPAELRQDPPSAPELAPRVGDSLAA